ncbi:hypothetical protein [Sinomonas sp. ASV322]|uniref:hypothetical protein n=1 Tax=Sinomonas sp. ASV322 TaxID=3041920 RepID=UPI0027DC7857|nr:hypothetical protein [Sinomonas sp. ASV322]MDQ4503056.1 hypothetical protein [Sinomonas sp. ASV322]
MSDFPWYVWAIALVGIVGIPAAACMLLYRGAVQQGAGRRRSALLAGTAAVLLAGGLVASAALAAAGLYGGRTAGQPPWLAVAFVLAFGGLLAATRIPLVARALEAPGMTSSLILVNALRVAGLAFVLAMFLGQVPALFALPAGLGDIAVGVAAPFIAARVAKGQSYRGAMWLEALGILDLVVALTLGALTGFQVVDVTPVNHAIAQLPLALIPTFTVPLILAIHIVSTRQLYKSRPRVKASTASALPA